MKENLKKIYGLAFTQTAKRTYLTTFGSMLSALFGFVFSIAVARSISPSDFGIFSVAMNFVTIIFVICDIGLSSSVLRFLPQAIKDGKQEESRKIIKLAFAFTVFISTLLSSLLLIFASPIANNIFSSKDLVFPIMVVSVSLVGLTLTFLFVTVLQSQEKFLFAVITDNTVYFLKVLFVLIFLFLGRLDLNAVLIIYTVTTFIGVFIGLIFIKPKFLLSKFDWQLGKSLLFFGAWIALARVANSISSRIDTLMLIRYVSADQVGFYAAAQRMTFIFLILINGMTAVLSPKFAGLKTKQEALSLFKKSGLLISLLIIPIVVIYLIAPWITIWIFGESYFSSIYIFRWLLISSFFFTLTSIPTLGLLYYLGYAKHFAFLSILQLVIIFLGNLIFIPIYGVVGPSISLALAYGTIFIASLLIFFKGLETYDKKEHNLG